MTHILLKSAKKMPQNDFPSLRSLFSDRLLICVAGLLVSGGTFAAGSASGIDVDIDGEIVLQYFSSPDVPTTFGTVRPYVTSDLSLTGAAPLSLHASAWFGGDNAPLVNLDELSVRWSVLPDDRLDISFGRQYLPFGHFSTAMASAPLTVDFGSVRSSRALIIDSDSGDWAESLYLFDGSEAPAATEEASDSGFGLRLGKYFSTEVVDVELGYDYISNINGAEDFFPGSLQQKLAAQGFSLGVEAERLSLSVEHLALLDALQPGDLDGVVEFPVRPAVTWFEMALSLEDGGAVFASLGKTHNAEQLELHQRSAGFGWRRRLNDRSSIIAEMNWLTLADGVTERIVGLELALGFNL